MDLNKIKQENGSSNVIVITFAKNGDMKIHGDCPCDIAALAIVTAINDGSFKENYIER